MATRKTGKAYVWVTWLTSLLGGKQCVWSAWFRANFKYEKFEEEAFDLAQWNRDHSRLMRDRRAELEADGWTVTVENQNEFKLEFDTAVLAGKPDIIAKKQGRVLIIDGKTGRERDSDLWQVMVYLRAYQKTHPNMTESLEGEVQYKRGGQRVSVTLDELTPQRRDDVVTMMATLGSPNPPPKTPSRDECRRCSVGFGDCPERVGPKTQQAVVTAAEF